jgi:hypothetical protein
MERNAGKKRSTHLSSEVHVLFPPPLRDFKLKLTSVLSVFYIDEVFILLSVAQIKSSSCF